VRHTDRLISILAVLVILFYFFGLVSPALRGYFVPDDLMNLYRSWANPATMLVKANFLFFWASPFYRPFPSVWYRVVFHLAGFEPFVFHASYLVILLTNVLLTYAVLRGISTPKEVALVTTLLGSYYTRLNYVFFDTSYIYDALCYTFYFGAFLVYVRVRQRQQWPDAGDLAVFSLLYVCALNSKETAVTMPLVLLSYELVFHPPRFRRVGEIARWLLREGRAAMAAGAITLVFVIGRLTGANSLAANPAYRPQLTWGRFMETSRHFLSELIPMNIAWNDARVVALFGVLALIAWAARSKALRFAWLFLIVSPLPIAFIPPRGLAQYYIPWFGWVLFTGTVLVSSIAWLTRKLPADPIRIEQLRGPLLLLSLALALYPYYHRKGSFNVASVNLEGPMIRDMAQQMRALYPLLQPGSRLLFLDDPFTPDRYDLTFLVRLLYRDDSLLVDRVKNMGNGQAAPELAAYDHVIDYREGKFFERKRPWPPGLAHGLRWALGR
jgi:hypothetical protein